MSWISFSSISKRLVDRGDQSYPGWGDQSWDNREMRDRMLLTCNNATEILLEENKSQRYFANFVKKEKNTRKWTKDLFLFLQGMMNLVLKVIFLMQIAWHSGNEFVISVSYISRIFNSFNLKLTKKHVKITDGSP